MIFLYFCRVFLRDIPLPCGVMVAQQILVLFVWVRVLSGQQKQKACKCKPFVFLGLEIRIHFVVFHFRVLAVSVGDGERRIALIAAFGKDDGVVLVG